MVFITWKSSNLGVVFDGQLPACVASRISDGPLLSVLRRSSDDVRLGLGLWDLWGRYWESTRTGESQTQAPCGGWLRRLRVLRSGFARDEQENIGLRPSRARFPSRFGVTQAWPWQRWVPSPLPC